MSSRKHIRATAVSFVDEKELKGNLGFQNPKFEALMKLTGWRKGQAWCAFFVELVWRQANIGGIGLFSGSTVQTWRNFNKGMYATSSIPQVGDVVIWQTYRNGKPRWTGHAGIVIAVVGANQIVTVEGNTNSNGGREGIEVAIKIRSRNYATKNGLRMLGFIKPIINND